jgi:hypothetical protein
MGKCVYATQGVFYREVSGEVLGDVEISYVAYMERGLKWKCANLF